ncbi:MAG: cell division protein SepF [Ruminococcaceae bacterium]|nr:cell division protein SepF [Oscillospiraceae bacterium]
MNFVNKLLTMIGFNDNDDFDDELFDETEEEGTEKSVNKFDTESEVGADGKKSKVVKIHTTAQLKLVVMQPESFDDARDIANHLKNKKPVVMNLEFVEKDIARRIVDFLSGAVYAVDGNIQKVSNGIFIITPYNVGIMGDFKDELRSKGIFPWSN